MTADDPLLGLLKTHIETGIRNRVGQRRVIISLSVRPNEELMNQLRAWLKEEQGAKRVQFVSAPRPSRVTISF